LAIAQLAKQEGMTAKEVRTWLNENDLQIHHYKGQQMQLVPAALHRLAHQGGAFDLRNQVPSP
jgi:phage antirepressor YoqD-like protein